MGILLDHIKARTRFEKYNIRFTIVQNHKPDPAPASFIKRPDGLKICPVSMLDGSARRFAIAASSSSKALEVQEAI
jgi:hypothetical protein